MKNKHIIFAWIMILGVIILSLIIFAAISEATELTHHAMVKINGSNFDLMRPLVKLTLLMSIREIEFPRDGDDCFMVYSSRGFELSRISFILYTEHGAGITIERLPETIGEDSEEISD